MSASIASETADRYAHLAALLDHDPDNLALLADTAEAAFAADAFDDAAGLLDRHARIAPLEAREQHLAGLIAMRRQDWEGAAEIYAALLAGGADAPPVRFNLGWSLAMARHFDAALATLDEVTSVSLPQAAQLEVQLLHQLGAFERAGERARLLLALHPAHPGLNAIVSTLALDIEDRDLALQCARNGGDHPDALTTLGMFALDGGAPEEAAELFDAVLARTPDAARARIGRGLVRLLGDDKAQAARDLDRGAEIFGTHLGSWIAAGWAHVLAGDLARGKARFETALALDETFGEAQGSLAVIDLLEGRIEEAQRRTLVAQRLDRQSFSAALAAMLLAAGAGDKDRAERIFQTALNVSIDEEGNTLAQALTKLGLAGR